jgi:glutathione S-transferase
MYELKGNHCVKFLIIEAILKIKDIKFKTTPYEGLELVTRENIFSSAPTIILYLDSRYPVPELISGSPIERAQLCQAATFVHQLPSEADNLALQASPFVFGSKLTLIDLLVWAYTSNKKYKSFMDGVINAKN